jgi:hypothetical protein
MAYSYQLADASAGVAYTFVVTLAILYFMKVVVYVFRRCFTPEHTGWWATAGFDEEYPLEDRLQATEQQRWSERNHPEQQPTIADQSVAQGPIPLVADTSVPVPAASTS